MKRILSVCVGLILTASLCACDSDVVKIKGKRVDIISEYNINLEWKTVYLQQLLNVDEKKYESFSLIYVDNDNIPEMFFKSNSHITPSILFWVYNNEIYSTELSFNGFYYFEKQNLFLNSGGFTGACWDTIYKLNNKTAENICDGNYCVVKGHESFRFNDSDFDSIEQYVDARNCLFDTNKAFIPKEQLSLSELQEAIKNF